VNLELVTFRPGLAAEWDRVAARSPEAWLFHRADWLELERHEAGTHPLSFGVRDGGELVAIVPIYLQRRRLAPGLRRDVLTTGHARAGPALVPGLSERRRKKILRAIGAGLDELAARRQADALEIRLPPLAPANLPPLRPSVNPLIALGLDDQLVVGKLVALQRDEEQLWRDVEPPFQRMIRQARRHGLQVVERSDMDAAAVFHTLHAATYARTGAEARPLSYFRYLWARFVQGGHGQALFVESDGRPIAAMLLLASAPGATYWAGCSDPAMVHLRPNHLLMWEAIRWARSAGLAWFELGPIPRGQFVSAKLRALGRFKERFGGEYMYEFAGTRAYRPLKHTLIELGLTLRRALLERQQRRGHGAAAPRLEE
jgi:CelD/BcsL family acetyltransferase involved in cellulose biosynthesis